MANVELKLDLKGGVDTVRKAIKREMVKTMFIWEASAKRNVGVDTGRLRAEIHHKIVGTL